jgi:hypothetical protein
MRSEASVGRIWDAFGFESHRVNTFKVSKYRHFTERRPGQFRGPRGTGVELSTVRLPWRELGIEYLRR